MVPGMIMLWYGSIETIPSGWHLCDGTMGTPNLVNKFVAGAGSWWDPLQLGGATSHDHDFTGDGHSHGLVVGDSIIDSAPAGDFIDTTSINPATGTTDTESNLPPFMALCFIMKL